MLNKLIIGLCAIALIGVISVGYMVMQGAKPETVYTTAMAEKIRGETENGDSFKDAKARARLAYDKNKLPLFDQSSLSPHATPQPKPPIAGRVGIIWQEGERAAQSFEEEIKTDVLYPVSFWQKAFDAWAAHEDREVDGGIMPFERLARTPNASVLYNLGFQAKAYTYAWMATEDPKYLERALMMIEGPIKTAKPASELGTAFSYGDDYLSWAGINFFEDGTWTVTGEEIQAESQLFRVAALLIYEMSLRDDIMFSTRKSDDGLTYRQRRQAILDFTMTNVVEKWWSRRQSERVPVGHLILGQSIEIDFYARWAELVMMLDKVIERGDYTFTPKVFENENKKTTQVFATDENNVPQPMDAKDVLAALFNHLNGKKGVNTAASGFGYLDNPDTKNSHYRSLWNQVQPHPKNKNAYFWSDKWPVSGKDPLKTGQGEDVSHANLTFSAITLMMAHQSGGWQKSDLDKLRETVKIIWNDDRVNPLFNIYLGDTGQYKSVYTAEIFAVGQPLFGDKTGAEEMQLIFQRVRPWQNYRALHYAMLMHNAKLLGVAENTENKQTQAP